MVLQLIQTLDKQKRYLFACDCIEHILSLYGTILFDKNYLHKCNLFVKIIRRFAIMQKDIIETDKIFMKMFEMLKKLLVEAKATHIKPERWIKMGAAAVAHAITHAALGNTMSAARKCRIAAYWVVEGIGEYFKSMEIMKEEKKWQIERLIVYLGNGGIFNKLQK